MAMLDRSSIMKMSMGANAMDFWKGRGRAIAETCNLRKLGDDWIVPAESESGHYIVKPDHDGPRCTWASRRVGL